MSIGGGKQKSSTTSTQASESEDYGTAVWGAQSPYLQDLYGRSQNQFMSGYDGGAGWLLGNASNQNSASGNAIEQANNSLGNMNQDFARAYDSLGNSNNGLASGLNRLDESTMALRNFLNPSTTDPLAQAYARQMGQTFSEEFMPELRGNAALAGGLGGSRANIGAALGSQRSMQAIGDFNSSLYGQQQDRALAAAQGIGALSQGYAQNAAGYGSQAEGYTDIANLRGGQAQGYQNNAGAYQNMSQNSLGLADFARSMPWYQLNQYSGLLGLPVQNDLGAWTSSTATSKGGSSGGNFSFGIK